MSTPEDGRPSEPLKKRLIAVQGPTQLINVLAILRFQREKEDGSRFEDHLIIGGTAVKDRNLSDLSETCRKIARSWDFESTADLDDFKLCHIEGKSFKESVAFVRNLVGIPTFYSIYVCRNGQVFNELVLNAFPGAKNICYGDGFGTIDLNNDSYYRGTFSPDGYCKIHEAYLFCPVQEDPAQNSFNLLSRLVTPPHRFMVETIHEIARQMPDLEDYCGRLLSGRENKARTLVLTSNYTEASFFKYNRFRVVAMLCINKLLLKISRGRNWLPINMNPKRELAMYVEQLKRHDFQGSTIFIKGHPRECLSQSSSVAKYLKNTGHDVIEIQDHKNYPIELYSVFLQFKSVIALGSSSATSLKIMHPNAKVTPLIDRDIREDYFRKEKLALTGPEFSYFFELDCTIGDRTCDSEMHPQ